ncbi:MAG: hypothetical protein P1U56_06560 [Saprospiraceae bacterium]|nr:hypothetical protein [Saprospiraceae bacterium]
MDALFREGAERHEFEYNADAWAMMEEKLDEKDRKRRIFFYLIGFLAILALISGISYMTLIHDSNQAVIADVNPPVVNDFTNDKVEESTILKNNAVSIDQNKNDQFSTKEIKENISADSKERTGNILAHNSFQSENTGNLIGNEIVSIPSQAAEEHQEKLIVNDRSDSDLVFEDKAEEVTNNKLSIDRKVHISILPHNTFSTLIKKDAFKSFDLKPERMNNNQSTISNKNRFAFTLFANPEWSSVGFFKNPRTGWSFGTKIGYQFADKFEISTGIALSRKIYKGSGGEYTMDGGWYQDIEPMEIKAKCDVIEIPLSLSYYISGFRNTGFFADLGINSYMMHTEWYGFAYDDALIRPQDFIEVTKEDENSHLVGVGRFAIGYQKVLSKHTSFQIAPYLQFPLTGIGSGRVNLFSSGVQIAVKFNTH